MFGFSNIGLLIPTSNCEFISHNMFPEKIIDGKEELDMAATIDNSVKS